MQAKPEMKASSPRRAATGAGPGLLAEPAGSLAAPIVSPTEEYDMFSDEPEQSASGSKRTAPSIMGFGRRRDQEQMPVDIPELLDGVKVDVYVRCRPLFTEEQKAGEKIVLRVDESEAGVKMRSPGHGGMEQYYFDATFGPEASQEQVYMRAAKPIVDNVLRGMNTCMFAYGQTGTGKTHTTVGDLREEANAGIIPRAVRDIFEQLRARGGPFKMSVSFLEVYNEQLMDLLIPAEATRPLRLVEDPRRGVVCQNLTEVPVVNPDEVFSLIAAGNRRCQVAATNMNERSNRAHRIFIVTVAFSKMYGAGSRLKEAEAILKARSGKGGTELDELGCLTIVDLAGSECVGRSGATDTRLTEAGNINKSLLALGRVINALANNEPRIPYRDSKLTRLVAEALGGRCKTAIIATVAPGSMNAQESASTLKYAERAKSALNTTQLSKTQVLEAKLTRLAQLYKELQTDMQNEREMFEQERQFMTRTHNQHLEMLRKQRREEIQRIVDQRNAMLRQELDAIQSVQRTDASHLRTSRKLTSKAEASIAQELQTIVADADALCETATNLTKMSSEKVLAHSESVAALVSHLGNKLKQLALSVQAQVDKAMEQLAQQRKILDEFGEGEARAMKTTSEEMIQSLAKLLSRHVATHAQRMQQTLGRATANQKEIMSDVGKVSQMTQAASMSVAKSVFEWSKGATDGLATLLHDMEDKQASALQRASKIREGSDRCKGVAAADLREIYTATQQHSGVIEQDTRRAQEQLEMALRQKFDVPEDLPGASAIMSPSGGSAPSTDPVTSPVSQAFAQSFGRLDAPMPLPTPHEAGKVSPRPDSFGTPFASSVTTPQGTTTITKAVNWAVPTSITRVINDDGSVVGTQWTPLPLAAGPHDADVSSDEFSAYQPRAQPPKASVKPQVHHESVAVAATSYSPETERIVKSLLAGVNSAPLTQDDQSSRQHTTGASSSAKARRPTQHSPRSSGQSDTSSTQQASSRVAPPPAPVAPELEETNPMMTLDGVDSFQMLSDMGKQLADRARETRLKTARVVTTSGKSDVDPNPQSQQTLMPFGSVSPDLLASIGAAGLSTSPPMLMTGKPGSTDAFSTS